jgi:hypothetical protein
LAEVEEHQELKLMGLQVVQAVVLGLQKQVDLVP